MNKIIIQKANVICNRDESTMVRVDKRLHERIKEISESTGYSVQYIVNYLLKEAADAVEIVD